MLHRDAGGLTEVVMFALWDSLDAIRSFAAMSTSLHGFIQRTTGSSSSVISWPTTTPSLRTARHGERVARLLEVEG
jgi:hypothetical protein